MIAQVLFVLVLAMFLSYGYWLNASWVDNIIGSLVGSVLFFIFYKIISILL